MKIIQSIGILLIVILINPPLSAQSLQGIWKGKIYRNTRIQDYEAEVPSNPQNVKCTTLEGIFCYGTTGRNSSIKLDTRSGKVILREARLDRNTNQDIKCDGKGIGSKILTLHPVLSPDRSYLNLQGTSNRGGYVHLYKKIGPRDAEDWAPYDIRNRFKNEEPPVKGPTIYQFGKGAEGRKDNCKVEIKGNVMYLKAKQQGSYTLELAEDLPLSFDISMNFAIRSEPHKMSFIWGLGSAGMLANRFDVDQLEAKIIPSTIKQQDGWDLASQMVMFGENRLRISKVLNEVSYYINGKKIATVEAPILAGNAIKWKMAEGGELQISNFEIRSLERFGPQLSISSIRYEDNLQSEKIVAANPGGIYCEVINRGQMDAPALTLRLANNLLGTEVVATYNELDTKSIPPGQSRSFYFPITPGYELETGSSEVRLSLESNGQTLLQKSRTYPTEPFFLAKRVLPPAESERKQALDLLFGKQGVDIFEGKQNLEDLIRQGDPLAKMWKAVFLAKGEHGYPKDLPVALDLALQAYSEVLKSARNGEVEAIYQLCYAYELGCMNYGSVDFKTMLLNKAVEAQFAPAIMDQGLLAYQNNDFSRALAFFDEAYELGMAQAGFYQGKIYELGKIDGIRSFEKAREYYLRSASKGEGYSMMALAQLYRDPLFGRPDAQQALFWAEKAADKGNSYGMVYLADIYISGNQGVPKDSKKALDLYEKAVEAGNNEAKMALGNLYLDGKDLGFRDNSLGRRLIKEAALSGNAFAMATMGNISSGIEAKFWYGYAAENGLGEKTKTNKYGYINAFLSSADFSPNVYKVTRYNPYTGSRGQSSIETDWVETALEGLLTGIIGVFQAKYSQKQKILDGISPLNQQGRISTFGAVASSKVNTGIRLRPGMTLKLQCFGEVGFYNASLWDSKGPEEGSSRPNDQRICAEIPHGKLMYRIGNGPWKESNRGGSIRVDQSGQLEIAVNDRNYRNNKGYYYLKIDIIQ